MMIRFVPHTVTLAALLLAAAHVAQAQMNNAPFSFRNSPGGLGMSTGGREAILNEKILGSRPENMLRDPSGRLLSVQEGPGGGAFVTYPGTDTFIPQYRTGWRDYSPDMSAGVFNSFFSPNVWASTFVPPGVATHSGATINTWTGRVGTGAPMSYLGEGNTVDVWTGQVFVLNF